MNNKSLKKNKIRILLLEGIHQSAVDVLLRAGYDNIEQVATALPEAELIEKMRTAHFVGIRSRTQLTQAVFDAADKLIAVGCFCIGTNQVDLNAATEKGVVVFNAPYSNTRSVAELVLAESILLLRRVAERSASCHRGGWMKDAKKSFESRGKVLGIIGYGNIGTQLGILAEGLGMHVRYYDVANKLPLGNAQPVGDLNSLLAMSDVVTMHVPENASTEWMMGAEQFALMKQDAVLINASRGTVVDIDALAAALGSGKLLGAAVDVFPVEPRGNDDPFVSPLQAFDNVFLTPHIGGSTLEAQRNIGAEVAEKLATFSDNGTSVSAVNFPEVALPAHHDKHRILHIHRNIPGVMSEINSVLSESNINISSQYLQTNASVGYVVIEVDQDCGAKALDMIKAVKGTIRSRILF
jgi:D-3-phosphoglycerate dehydrogenase